MFKILTRSTYRKLFEFNGDRACPVCKELTASRTKKTIKRATTRSKGKKLISDRCHCCNYYEENIKIIPRLSSSSSHSSSRPNRSGNSKGGSSFGGGSSRGDGGGGSW